jgi:hypothetical protein
MASIQSEWASDAFEILGEIPKQVTVKNVPSGQPIPLNALMSEPSVMQDIETGGFVNHTSFDVKFLRTDSVANPGLIAFGNIITFANNQYRIMSVTDRPPSAWIICKVQTKVQ